MESFICECGMGIFDPAFSALHISASTWMYVKMRIAAWFKLSYWSSRYTTSLRYFCVGVALQYDCRIYVIGWLYSAVNRTGLWWESELSWRRRINWRSRCLFNFLPVLGSILRDLFTSPEQKGCRHFRHFIFRRSHWRWEMKPMILSIGGKLEKMSRLFLQNGLSVHYPVADDIQGLPLGLRSWAVEILSPMKNLWQELAETNTGIS